ncbi:hypothetical protein Clacol_009931 [Clathrus columnatus]|uniref:Uncharacterized protein n=1 Tax=Clathrus columnatus TaxID=1419009 RepID=A0AAV5ARJ8_9AGAM|nr:hypothetical protein Clacol_009931 [Clathrus columnatus]
MTTSNEENSSAAPAGNPNATLEPNIVESYMGECRRHFTEEISRTEAIINILGHIGGSTRGEGIRNLSLRSHLGVLDQNEDARRRETEQNRSQGPPIQRLLEQTIGSTPQEQEVGAGGEANVDSRLGKRPRNRVDDSESDGEGEDEGTFDESSLPWYRADRMKENELPADVKETRKWALQYSQNFKKVKRSLLTSFKRPEFPESEWDNLLRNRPIDLNRVLGHFTHARNDSATEIQIGSARIRTATEHGSTFGQELLKQQQHSIHTGWMSSHNTVTSSAGYSWQVMQPGSSYMMPLAGPVLQQEVTSDSPMQTNSRTSISHISTMVSVLKNSRKGKEESLEPQLTLEGPAGLLKFATGTTAEPVPMTAPPADIGTYARPAGSLGTERETLSVLRKGSSGVERDYTRPRFTRGLIWDNSHLNYSSVISATKYLPAVPSPPENEVNNKTALSTISAHPELFKIITPIWVWVFEALLMKHPNRPLVLSVCRAL